MPTLHRRDFPACGTDFAAQNETMNSALWIAIGAAVIVVLAHIGLFWWFICKGNKKPPSDQ
jgi:flagellar basal body-associated protein FliL